MLRLSLTSTAAAERARQTCRRSSTLLARKRWASSMATGLVGLPNVGKSTLFNALAHQELSEASNRPFTTIVAKTALAPVSDPRLRVLSEINRSLSSVRLLVEYTDIAGLVSGASNGEGRGNAFLQDIRNTQAIAHVVRCFENEDILHVCQGQPGQRTVDPVRDIDIIWTELILADLQSLEKRLEHKAKLGKTAEGLITQRLLLAAKELLENSLPASLYESKLDVTEKPVWAKLQLLTQKPMLYVCNVEEDSASKGNALSAAVEGYVLEKQKEFARIMGAKEILAAAPAVPAAGKKQQQQAAAGGSTVAAQPSAAAPANPVCVVCAKLEAEAVLLSEEDRDAFLTEYGLQETGLQKVMETSNKLLGLQTFYTSGPTETRAWSIPVGSTAQEAAACIHTDIARTFIKAEVTHYQDYVQAGGEKAAKDAALTQSVGRDYIMQDGDVVFFKHGGAK